MEQMHSLVLPLLRPVEPTGEGFECRKWPTSTFDLCGRPKHFTILHCPAEPATTGCLSALVCHLRRDRFYAQSGRCPQNRCQSSRSPSVSLAHVSTWFTVVWPLHALQPLGATGERLWAATHLVSYLSVG
ncbi:unnamed protein product [Arctia plantaginis]|uniref:Uncharacterized protein n=1 Tax=Arctia plantaginis TaxID=874455 RepID=A0A8S0Z287_ARCPL|nr:unnamed protein product [Arctia plantaginis]